MALTLAGAVALALWRPWSNRYPGASHVKSLIAWDPSCADVRIDGFSARTRPWPDTQETAAIECEYAGPDVIYARFPSVATLKRNMLRKPPASGVCLAGREVVVDYLDPGDFAPMCRKLHGYVVDGVSGVVPDNRLDDDRLTTAAEGRALRRRWGSGS
jgi:hypothetical protein